MSTAQTTSEDVARFLREHPPFDALEPGAVERVAAAAEVEEVTAGTTIFAPGERPITQLRVIRSGAVEIIADGRVLDLLGPGEVFGHASMLSGLPVGFEARAAEDTVCYRIAVGVAEQVLSAPAGLRYVARSLLEPPTQLHTLAREPNRNLADQPVGGLLGGDPVVCAPDTPIRTAAERMTAARASAVIVDLGADGLGIVTDRDFRTRVVAAGLSSDDPVSSAMTSPAYTCRPDRPAGEVLLEMFDRGIRHFPIVSATGSVLGVVEAADILVARTRSSFYLRQRIAESRSVSELAVVAGELRPMVVALHDARVGAANVMAVYSAAVDALTRRLLELALARRPPLEINFAWLALGSQARREALPSSDVDSAIVWFGDGDGEGDGGGGSDGDGDEAETKRSLLELAGEVVSGLERCGIRADEHGASASADIFVRSMESWRRVIQSWIANPNQEKALILTSVLVDSRPVWGVRTGTPVADTFRLAPSSPALLRLLARFALSHRPPTGFFRGLVVEHTGEHRGRLDLKLGGVTPIVDLARWAGMSAGVTIASTTERLRAAGAAGTLSSEDVRTLDDAFRLITDLRTQHQVGQLRSGLEPDDHIDPAALSPLMRTQLREAFRAVAAVQRRLASELNLGAR